VSASFPPTLGLVLAGGLARRMGGGDKARIAIGGVTILQRVLACLEQQCIRVVINANGDPARFADTKLPVVADSVPDFAGPLAGILAGLDWAALHVPECEWLASAPGDCPFLPNDLVARLHAEGVRKIEIWTARHGVAIADWPAAPVDPFFNVNTPDDAAQAQAMAAAL
jgi:molybdopterin-guanine dinucleotide biosynthesis protein A